MQAEIDSLEAGDDVKTYLARLKASPAVDLQTRFPEAGSEELAILKGMLTFLACDRLTLDEALDNPILSSAETPGDVDDDATVNYTAPKLSRKSSNLAVSRSPGTLNPKPCREDLPSRNKAEITALSV